MICIFRNSNLFPSLIHAARKHGLASIRPFQKRQSAHAQSVLQLIQLLRHSGSVIIMSLLRKALMIVVGSLVPLESRTLRIKLFSSAGKTGKSPELTQMRSNLDCQNFPVSRIPTLLHWRNSRGSSVLENLLEQVQQETINSKKTTAAPSKFRAKNKTIKSRKSRTYNKRLMYASRDKNTPQLIPFFPLYTIFDVA